MPPAPPCPDRRRIELDASPWGAGAVLFEDGRPTRCFSFAWRQRDFDGNWRSPRLSVRVGQSSSQTFFETLVVLMALELWCTDSTPTVVLGDNTAALQDALDLKGKGPSEKVAQCLAVLRCSRSLCIAVAHLATEANELADCLSRQAEPGNTKPWPFSPEARVEIDVPLRPMTLFKALAAGLPSR